MGRAPCCDKMNVKKGPWAPEEDAKLRDFINKNGTGGNWIALPQKAGLKRCGKSCRLRWLNYLRPNIKHGDFTDEEDRVILTLYTAIGSRWSIIASHLQGRTDNDIKNYWNTKLKKKIMALANQRKQILTLTPNQTPSLAPYQTQYQQNQTQYRDLSSTPYYSPMTPSFPITTPLATNNAISFHNNAPLPTDFCSAIQAQEMGTLMSAMSMNYPGSCSSSDGSCTQMKQDDNFALQNGFCQFEDYKEIGADLEQNIEGYFGNNNNSGVEEVKQLINSSMNNNNNNDETKTIEFGYYFSNFY